jgi:transposase
MKAYSLDLRQKIIDTFEAEVMLTQQQLADRFRVNKSFIIKLLKQYRETSDIAPKPHGGGHQLKLDAFQLVSLVEIVQENNDATLKEYCNLLEEKEQVTVSTSTMCTLMQRLDLRRKKKLCTPLKNTQRESSKCVLTTGISSKMSNQKI